MSSEIEVNVPLRVRHRIYYYCLIVFQGSTNLNPAVALLGEAPIKSGKVLVPISEERGGTAKRASNKPGGGVGAL